MNAPGWQFNTFTIIGRCPREGLLGIGLTSSPLAVTSRCPFIKANVGAVSSQAPNPRTRALHASHDAPRSGLI